MKPLALPFEWAECHTAGAVRLGVSLDGLLKKSLIFPQHGDERDAISPVQASLLCMNTTLALQDATHGLGKAGVGSSYPAIGLRMALGSSTLDGAIRALSRLYGSASDGIHIQLRTEPETATLSIHMDAIDESDAAYLEENYLVWMFMHCLHFLGRAPTVFEVTLRDPRHFNLGAPHWAIGGPVVHGATTSFRFSRQWLGAAPVARAGENVFWEVHQPWLAFVGGGLPAPALDAYVSDLGFVRFADLVEESGKSANTLRRRLEHEDGRFRDARRRALVRAASDRLCSGDESVEAIALDLGYSDDRSFRRFLKAATGFTPQQVRARGGVGDAEQDRRVLSELQAISEQLSL